MNSGIRFFRYVYFCIAAVGSDIVVVAVCFSWLYAKSIGIRVAYGMINVALLLAG